MREVVTSVEIAVQCVGYGADGYASGVCVVTSIEDEHSYLILRFEQYT
jgi:hypothetical protein